MQTFNDKDKLLLNYPQGFHGSYISLLYFTNVADSGNYTLEIYDSEEAERNEENEEGR